MKEKKTKLRKDASIRLPIAIEKINGLSYGSVETIVRNSDVAQVVIKENIRLDEPAAADKPTPIDVPPV